ncbi:MAG: histone deacetylase family protein [Pirellulaceae bacterium]
MTLLYYDPIYLRHDTGHHPECAERLVSITARLAADGLDARCGRPAWEPAERAALGRVHHVGYIDSVERFVSRGGGYIERDTAVSRDSFQAAITAAGAAVDATRRVVRGEDSQALCLVRPPGHHAVHVSAMGFCLFNNIAIAARAATAELDLDRVLIVDWDVHHGNGTQATFWEDEQVGVFSIHRAPFYPGTGDEDETGAGKGLGTTRNLAIRFGTARCEYTTRFADELASFADKIRPQLVLISAGFDTHALDPVGSLGLEDEDFVSLTHVVLDIAEHFAEGRVVSTLEGGYNLHVLPGSVAAHLETMLARCPHVRPQSEDPRQGSDGP